MAIKSVNKRIELYDLYQRTWLGIILGLIVSFIVFTIQDEEVAGIYTWNILLLSEAILVVPAIYKFFLVRRWLKKRKKQFISQVMSRADLQYVPIANVHNNLSTTLLEFAGKNVHFEDVVTNGDWICGDFSYEVFNKNKRGEYKITTVFYYVGHIVLPRQLPHVFFDAKATKGKEYQRLFDSSQRHSLEGDFDTFFDTYFPIHYPIDSLSFITPEVMQAMIALKDYDIEILGDRLYLSCPLRPMPEQLQDMSEGLVRLKKALLNNIVTYRDERVPYEKGRQDISVIGMNLRRNLTGFYISAIFGFVLLTGTIAFHFFFTVFSEALFYGVALGGGMLISSVKTIRHERRQRALYDAMQRNFVAKREAAKPTNKSSKN